VRRFVGAIAVLATGALVLLTTTGVADASALQSKILSISNMPPGWSLTHKPPSNSTPPACLQAIKAGKNKPGRESVTFVKGTEPVLAETIVEGKAQMKRWRLLQSSLDKCRSFSLTLTGKHTTGSVGQMSFPAVAAHSVAYSMTLTVTNINLGYDIVLFKTGQVAAMVGYGEIGTPDVTTVTAFVKEAVAKAQGQPVAAPDTST